MPEIEKTKGEGKHSSFRLGKTKEILVWLAGTWDCSLTTAMKRLIQREGERKGWGREGVK